MRRRDDAAGANHAGNPMELRANRGSIAARPVIARNRMAGRQG
jgi:hypothetical protein